MMTAQQLKNSILQRAIEGKLVEQRSEEGTAKELLKQIKQEKEKLVKEGKIKKSKPLPAITEDEIPFEIPESWEWVRLGDILNKLTDGTHHSPTNTANGKYKYITAKNIKESGIDEKDISYVTAEIHNEIYSRCNPEKGDILLIKDGATTGIVTCNNLDEPFSMLSSVALLKTSNYIFAWYIVYVLRSDIFYQLMRKQMKGTGITRITLKQIAPFLVPLPPLSEQQRIVAKIEELMPLVEQYNKAYSQLTASNEKFPQDMKKSILQYAIEGKLVEQRPEEGTAKDLLKEIKMEKEKLIKEGKIKKSKPLPAITEDEIPFEIPESWEWVRLGVVADINGGYAFKSANYSEKGIRVVRISDFNENGFVNNKVVKHIFKDEFIPFLLEEKNILLCMTGGTVGKSIFVSTLKEKMMVNQRVATIKIRYSVPEYININILAPFIQFAIQQNKNSTNDNISMETIKNFPIPLPPLSEQKRIVARIEQLLLLCDKLAVSS